MRRSRNPQVFLPPLAREAIISVETYDDKPRAGDERNRTRDKDDRKEKKGKEGLTMWADVRLGLGQLGPHHHQKGDKRNRRCNT